MSSTTATGTGQPDGLLTVTALEIAKVSIYGGNGMSSFSTCQLSIIAAVVLLSPVLAFLIAIAVEILIGSLMAAGGVPALLVVVAAIWLVAAS
jgi:hypothetical protein